MHWWLIPASYLLGSISVSLALVSFLERQDLRRLGSGNTGATNVLRVAGKGPAVATLAFDIAKGAVPIWAGIRLGAPGAVLGAAALAVVVGHVYPIYHGFQGGKGVATAAGALGMLAPLVVAASILVFGLVVLTTRYVSLASILGVSAYPVVLALGLRSGLVSGSWWMVFTSLAVVSLVVLKHRDNIARLRAGTEPRVGEKGGPR